MAISYIRHEVLSLFPHLEYLFWALGFTIPFWWIWKKAKVNNFSKKRRKVLFGFLAVLAISIYFGSRFFHYFGPWGKGWMQYDGFFNLNQGGFVFYGGLIGAMIGGYIYLKLVKENIGQIADICAPAIALGQFITRLTHCFFLGDDFGVSSNLPWAIKFLGPGYTYLMNKTLHPVQIYLSLGNLLLFIVLLELARNKRWQGEVFAKYLLLYGTMRFFLEYFRDTTESTATIVFGNILTYSQIISIFLIIFSLSVMYYQKYTKKDRNNHPSIH